MLFISSPNRVTALRRNIGIPYASERLVTQFKNNISNDQKLPVPKSIPPNPPANHCLQGYERKKEQGEEQRKDPVTRDPKHLWGETGESNPSSSAIFTENRAKHTVANTHNFPGVSRRVIMRSSCNPGRV
jgi:hypothetical protein